MLLSSAIAFLLKSAVCSGLLLGYYWLFLHNKKLHQYNRFYLLSTVAISLIVPLLHFEWYQVAKPVTKPALKLMQITTGTGYEPEIHATAAPVITVDDVMLYLYALISMALLIIMVVRITWVYKTKRGSKVIKMNGYDLVATDNSKAPFSFMSNLFWRNDIDMYTDEGQQILKHELAHIHQKHSLDKIAMQMVTAVCWLNPCYWIIQKELAQIHEFIADEAAIADNDTEAFARMLLQTHYGNTFRDVVHPFFYSSVKRRLLMLNRSKKPKYNNLRKLMVLPVLAGSLLLFSFKIKSSNVERAKKTIVLALDAGHGGTDNGAVATDGTLEKDLNLKVAKKIAGLADEYNIKIVPLRMDDQYIPLEQRAAMANKANADILISLHVNSEEADPKVLDSNKYEMIVDERNVKYVESSWLASNLTFQMFITKRGYKISEKHLAILKDAKMPSVLIECGYLNNKNNLIALNDDAKLEILGRNILTAVVELKNNPPQAAPKGGTMILATPGKKVIVNGDTLKSK